VWEQEAEEDVMGILEYLAKISIETAISQTNEISNQIAKMSADVSRRGKIGRVNGTMELVILRTPYIAVYVDENHLLRIIRILHGSEVHGFRVIKVRE
jgi:plasmid stabilization system protein ParE